MECLLCKSNKENDVEMIHYGKFWFCKNGHSVPYTEYESNFSWIQQVLENRDLWCDEKQLQRIPAIISHEYYRIRQLMEQNKTYGALFQLKDAYETLIKYVTLYEVIKIYNSKTKSKEEIVILFMITEKILALGDWGNILEKINPLVNDKVIKPIIQDLLTIMDNNGPVKLVNWRNTVIGHGALSYDSSKEYQEMFVDKLKSLTEHIKKLHDNYEQLPLFEKTSEKYNLLNEKSMARKLKGERDGLYLAYRDNKIPAFPFMVIDEKEIFFFDAFIKRSSKTDALCYPSGIKKSYRKKDNIEILIDQINKEYSNAYNRTVLLEDINQSPDNPAFLKKMADNLIGIYKNRESVKMEFLGNWMSTQLEEYANGVFLIQMERGMGKTTFATQVDERIKKLIGFQNTKTKVFYISEAYKNTKKIIDGINMLLATDADSRTQLVDENRVYLNSSNNLPEVLNHYYEVLNNNGVGAAKIVLFIDGLDEISEEAMEILHFFNCSSGLRNGLYIFLTSRTESELSQYKSRLIKEIRQKATKSIEIKRKDASYNEFVKKYMIVKFENLNEEERTKILKQSNYNLPILEIIDSSLKKGLISDISKITGNGEIITCYLRNLFSCYGDKYEKYVKMVLYIMYFTNQPLTLKGISKHIGETSITFMLVGILTDLKGILADNKQEEEAVFSIAQPEFKASVWELIEGDLTNLEEEFERVWEELLLDFVEDSKYIEGNVDVEDIIFLKQFTLFPAFKKGNKLKKKLNAELLIKVIVNLYSYNKKYWTLGEYTGFECCDSLTSYIYENQDDNKKESISWLLAKLIYRANFNYNNLILGHGCETDYKKIIENYNFIYLIESTEFILTDLKKGIVRSKLETEGSFKDICDEVLFNLLIRGYENCFEALKICYHFTGLRERTFELTTRYINFKISIDDDFVNNFYQGNNKCSKDLIELQCERSNDICYRKNFDKSLNVKQGEQIYQKAVELFEKIYGEVPAYINLNSDILEIRKLTIAMALKCRLDYAKVYNILVNNDYSFNSTHEAEIAAGELIILAKEIYQTINILHGDSEIINFIIRTQQLALKGSLDIGKIYYLSNKIEPYHKWNKNGERILLYLSHRNKKLFRNEQVEIFIRLCYSYFYYYHFDKCFEYALRVVSIDIEEIRNFIGTIKEKDDIWISYGLSHGYLWACYSILFPNEEEKINYYKNKWRSFRDIPVFDQYKTYFFNEQAINRLKNQKPDMTIDENNKDQFVIRKTDGGTICICPQGKETSKVQIGLNEYEITYNRRICNSCSSKECEGYKKSGRIKLGFI